ncbi:ABC transporter permease [Rhizohabitans arisaemae]|uniref:ABC transporter permease n=1 Tax=Rhizohabitans arisaemae TaxID=2720610 RepID=UPI0024B2743F|nr:ABC transporter permease [Rhizohabitans arisaemae]
MTGFVLRRLAAGGGLLVAVSFLIFSLLHLAPGSPLTSLLGGQDASDEQIAALVREYRLDEPFLVQYGSWLARAVQLDFGRSILSHTSALARIGEFAPVSAQLAALTLVITVLVGIPLGMAAGLRRGRAADRLTSFAAVVGMSSPPFATGVLLIYVFGVGLGAPVFGAGGAGLDRLRHLILPAVALSIVLIAIVVRQTRAAVLDTCRQDHVVFGHARGLRISRILTRYVLRNSALPIVNTVGILVIQLAAGTVLVESVFSLPGIGTLMVNSVEAKDMPVIQALGMLIAVVVVLTNLLVDLVSIMIDPRLRLGVRTSP